MSCSSNKGNRGVLTNEQKGKLKSIEMVWDVPEYQWQLGLYHALQYYNKHNNLIIPTDYKTEDGYNLGAWLNTKRTAYKGIQGKITQEQIERLDSIGMIWNPLSYLLDTGYQYALQYYKKNNNLLVPQSYITEDDFKLGIWINSQRQAYKGNKYGLTKIQIEKLESIGMVWNYIEYTWKVGFLHAKQYYIENGTLRIPHNYVTKDGFKLWTWINNQSNISLP